MPVSSVGQLPVLQEWSLGTLREVFYSHGDNTCRLTILFPGPAFRIEFAPNLKSPVKSDQNNWISKKWHLGDEREANKDMT